MTSSWLEQHIQMRIVKLITINKGEAQVVGFQVTNSQLSIKPNYSAVLHPKLNCCQASSFKLIMINKG
jgi:hypothetical protein